EILAPLVAMAGVLAVYGIYAPVVGYINGRRMFTKQSALDMVAATLRTVGMLGLGWLMVKKGSSLPATLGTSAGMLGATIRAAIAAGCVLLLALRWTGTGTSWQGTRPSGAPEFGAYIRLVVPVMIAQLFVNGLMQADIFMLGRYLSVTAGSASSV